MFMLGLGEMLEDWTHKSRFPILRAPCRLMSTRFGSRRRKAKFSFPSGDISAGDKIVTRTGNMIPLDGKVYEGEALVNQASMTGESLPVRKNSGSYVLCRNGR